MIAHHKKDFADREEQKQWAEDLMELEQEWRALLEEVKAERG